MSAKTRNARSAGNRATAVPGRNVALRKIASRHPNVEKMARMDETVWMVRMGKTVKMVETGNMGATGKMAGTEKMV
jgi:hypothetical protein